MSKQASRRKIPELSLFRDLRVFHKGVTDHMADPHMCILDPPVVLRIDYNDFLGKLGQLASFAPDQRDGIHPIIHRPIDRFDQVRRVAAYAKSHYNVPWFSEILQLSRINIFVAVVIAEGSDPTDVVVQGMTAKARV